MFLAETQRREGGKINCGVKHEILPLRFAPVGKTKERHFGWDDIGGGAFLFEGVL